MSYADNENARRFNAASLAATALINGALVVGVASFTPGVADIFKDEGGEIIWIPTATPETPPDEVKTEATKSKPEEHVTAPPPVGTTGATGTNTLDGVKLAGGGDIDFPPLPPLGGTSVDPIPPTPDAVHIKAKIDPRYAGALQPAYPPGKARDGVEGVAVVRVLVSVDGRVKQVENVRATDEDFFEATRRQALMKWRFTPATLDGVPVESWREMTVRFNLDG